MTAGTPAAFRVQNALEALRAGRPVLVADDADRENEVDVIMAAGTTTQAWMAWLVRHTSGYVCAPIPHELAEHLDLPPMVQRSQDSLATDYTVSVDAAAGITTGISAADRTATVRALADPAATAADLIRPGHILPLRAVPGGLAQRPGHTEAAVELCTRAGLAPVGVIAELVHEAGEPMRTSAAAELAQQHDLVMLSISDLLATLAPASTTPEVTPLLTPLPLADPAPSRTDGPGVRHISTAQLPTIHGDLVVHAYADLRTGAEHLALLGSETRATTHPGTPTPVRVHSECLTGEALGSLRCDCGPQLDHALQLAAEHGGAVVYLRGHEGRGIGLAKKVAAYALQDAGRDTVQANLDLGHGADERDFGAAAAILQDLGLTQIDLHTSNPIKSSALQVAGIDVVGTHPTSGAWNPHNDTYLRTKVHQLGHDAALLDGAAEQEQISS